MLRNIAALISAKIDGFGQRVLLPLSPNEFHCAVFGPPGSIENCKMLVFKNAINILQGNVAKRLRFGGIFNRYFIATLLPFVLVEKF